LCKNKKIAVFFKTQILKKIKRKQKKYVVLPPPSTIISSLSLSLSLSLNINLQWLPQILHQNLKKPCFIGQVWLPKKIDQTSLGKQSIVVSLISTALATAWPIKTSSSLTHLLRESRGSDD
jgi:hypothetical protein